MMQALNYWIGDDRVSLEFKIDAVDGEVYDVECFSGDGRQIKLTEKQLQDAIDFIYGNKDD